MKKTIFICIGNVILFTLLGLTFLFPFSEIIQEDFGLGFSPSVFPFLLLIYFIAYPIVYHIVAKKYRLAKGADSELAFSDEREKIIVAESTKVAYKALVGGLLFIIATIGGVKFFSLFSGVEISIYMTTIILLTILLNVAMVTYCIKWCREYKK